MTPTAITVERLRTVLDYDPDAGQFTWRQRTSKRLWLSPACITVAAPEPELSLF